MGKIEAALLSMGIYLINLPAVETTLIEQVDLVVY